MRHITMLKIKFDTEAAFYNFYDFVNSKILCLKDIDVQVFDNDDEENPPKSEQGDLKNSSATPVQQTHDAIAEMSRAIKCLALELPGPVWEDVNKRWNAVLAQQHHA